MTTLNIKITTDPDGFFGAEPNPENYPNAYDKFCELVNAKIWEYYPGAEIEREFEPTMTTHQVYENDTDKTDDEIIDTVVDIETKIYNDGKFWN